jgi:transcriptional regulator with XRE-family HTH domain
VLVSETLYRAQVGRRLRAAIDALGISQADVAKTLNTAPSKLGNWLRGDNYPSAWFVKQFCDRYGITTDWIYRGVVAGMDANLANILWNAEQAASKTDPTKPNKASGSPKVSRAKDRSAACVVSVARTRGR